MNRLDYLVQVEDLHASPQLRSRIAALSEGKIPSRRRFRPWMGVCACLALALLAGGGLLISLPMGGSAGGSGHDEASTFMSYAGPVFPLTLGEENDDITAQRHITLDFSPWEPEWVSNEEDVAAMEGLTEEERQDALKQKNEWFTDGGYYRSYDHILVTDSYTLTNSSGTEQTVTIYYPFAASLEDLSSRQPTLTLGGTELDTELIAGGTSDKYSAESWEDYRAQLADGAYLESALGALPDASAISVIVYEFTEPYGPEESDEIPNPSIRVNMELDYDKTAILSYGFQGGSYDREAGSMIQDFSIPDPQEPDYGNSRYLLVIGADVTNLATEGRITGGFDSDTPALEDWGVNVERYESDLNTMLRAILAHALEQRMDVNDIRYTGLDFETCYRAVLDRFYQSGLPDNISDWYGTGCIEDFVSESFYMERVNWVKAQVAIPAGERITVDARFTKPGSYDYGCSNTQNKNIYGYDLVTQLGSNLVCTEQTATLEDRGLIEIVRQNFGFDLENGVKTVTLDANEEHYYLEVRRAQK